jgi:type I thyroxine 5'-deiodinase
VAFYVIYIEEAHPTDLWQMQSNVRAGVLFRSPKSDEERNETATACVRKLGIRISAVRDGIANRVERDYTGWPDRLYLIGRDGRVIFKSAPGPFGFEPAGLRSAIERTVSTNVSNAQPPANER